MYQPLVIRFWRKGASDYPVYDIVVTLKKNRYRGAFIERLGHYNPNGREKLFFFDGQRLGYWLNRGALLHPRISLHLPAHNIDWMKGLEERPKIEIPPIKKPPETPYRQSFKTPPSNFEPPRKRWWRKSR